MSLVDFGWGAPYEDAFAPYEPAGFAPGRVVTQHRGAVHAILPRTSAFSRKTAGARADEQVVAANVDTVLLVQAFGPDLNERRLERYLAAARESGAAPVVVLTKADLARDVDAERALVASATAGVPVACVSSLTGEGLEELDEFLAPRRTLALFGSSGAGKSTLVNRLLGEAVQPTAGLRNDGRGRHTTTRRELLRLPGGALVIDTPGMRELQLWIGEEALDATFLDVTSLAERCRFTDCRHRSEPGCAVRAAVADGSLPEERLESYRKLERERVALAARQDARLAADQRRERQRFERSLRRDRW